MPITSSNRRVNGLHHITAIAGPAQENVDFYAGILGMHLVKRSVNQDDPGTYHLFYADAEGNPGSDLTFFPWTRNAPPRLGHGLAVETSLEVPVGQPRATGRARLETYGVQVNADRDTLRRPQSAGRRYARLRADARRKRAAPTRRFTPWDGSPVPAGTSGSRAVRRAAVGTERRRARASSSRRSSASCRSATRTAGRATASAARPASWTSAQTPERAARRAGASAPCTIWPGAWTTTRDQLPMRDQLEDAGAAAITPVIDRFWFKSVYFANQAACSSRSRPTVRASRRTKTPRTSANRSCCRRGSNRMRGEIEGEAAPAHAARRRQASG